MLVQELRDDNPGAFYVIGYEYIWPSDGDLEIEKIYKRIAKRAAERLAPSDYDSVTDLVQKTNRNLARLGLPAISLVKTLSEVFEVESSPEITLPTF
jgi:hypothetical protein